MLRDCLYAFSRAFGIIRGETGADIDLFFRQFRDFVEGRGCYSNHNGKFDFQSGNDTGVNFATVQEGKVLDAINAYLDKTNKSDLLGSTVNSSIGKINIYAGFAGTPERNYSDGWGIEHIIARRAIKGEDVAQTLVGVAKTLASGRLISETHSRFILKRGDYVAVIEKNYKGAPNQFVLTGYRKELEKSGEPSRLTDKNLYAPPNSGFRSTLVADFKRRYNAFWKKFQQQTKNNQKRDESSSVQDSGFRGIR